ncbi:MAG TPA: glycosyltransferase, partial [Phycisphaerae bacterium]
PRYGTSRGLKQWLEKNSGTFDIIHLHGVWLFSNFAAAQACWRDAKPYVITPHGILDTYSIQQRSGLIKRLYWLLRERRVAARSAGIHCLNNAEVRRAVPWIAHMPKFILPNGIQTAQLSRMPPRGEYRQTLGEMATKPLVLFLSRVHPKKGLDRLIPAWVTVARQMPDVRLLIAGTGDAAYLDVLNNLVNANQLQEHVKFVGQLIGHEKWAALTDADLFVLPSHQEGFSVAVTEALAAGCVPVVTQESNYDELQNVPPSGIIVQNGDMQAFTAEVMKLLTDPARRAAMAAAGKTMVEERYTWEKIAADLEQVYSFILSGKKLRADGTAVWRLASCR